VEAVAFLRKSKLPENVLREIWKLSDLGRDGALDVVEFCIAMHLVIKVKNNIPLPAVLPAVLLPPAAEAEEKAKRDNEEVRQRVEKEAEAAKRAVVEQQQKEQQAKEQQAKEHALKEQQTKEQQAKDQQAKDQQAKDLQAKELHAKESQAKDQQAKDQQAKDQQAKDKQQKEQQLKEQQEKEKQQREQQQQKEKEQREQQQKEREQEQKRKEEQDEGEAKAADNDQKEGDAKAEAPGEPKVNKFKKPTGGDDGAAAPPGRREPAETKRPARSPAPRTRSPAARGGAKPGEPTTGWDNNVKVDPPEVPEKSVSKMPRIPAAQVTGGWLEASVQTKTPAIRKWIEELLNETIPPGLTLVDALKSGVRLCKVLNVIEPNSVMDISVQQFLRRENIIAFLDTLQKKGFKRNQLFVLEDLFENKDFDAVLQTLIYVDAWAGASGFDGPRLTMS